MTDVKLLALTDSAALLTCIVLFVYSSVTFWVSFSSDGIEQGVVVDGVDGNEAAPQGAPASMPEQAYYDEPLSNGQIEERVATPDSEPAMPAEEAAVTKDNFEVAPVEQIAESDVAEPSEANIQETTQPRPRK